MENNGLISFDPNLPLPTNRDFDKNNYQSQSPLVLMVTSTAFPFDLTPDAVVIDTDKVSITQNHIFGFQQISSVLIENVTHADVFTGFFTTTLHLIDSTNPRNPIDIMVPNLKVGDALKARMLIQELVRFKRQKMGYFVQNLNN